MTDDDKNRSDSLANQLLSKATVVDRLFVKGTTKVSAELADALHNELAALSKTTHRSKSDLIREAITALLQARKVSGPLPGVRSKQQAVIYSRLLIDALQDVLDFTSNRRHNEPPPALLVDNDTYLSEIRKLIAELKRFNDFIESSNNSIEAQVSTSNLSKHLNTFLDKYASSLGQGLGSTTSRVILVSTIGGLLYQIGFNEDIFQKLMKLFPLAKP